MGPLTVSMRSRSQTLTIWNWKFCRTLFILQYFLRAGIDAHADFGINGGGGGDGGVKYFWPREARKAEHSFTAENQVGTEPAIFQWFHIVHSGTTVYISGHLRRGCLSLLRSDVRWFSSVSNDEHLNPNQEFNKIIAEQYDGFSQFRSLLKVGFAFI